MVTGQRLGLHIVLPNLDLFPVKDRMVGMQKTAILMNAKVGAAWANGACRKTLPNQSTSLSYYM